MLVSDLIARARDLLLDSVAPYRSTDAELLRWVSDAQRVIVSLVPESYPESRSVKLATGTYRQAIPADALRLLDMPRNTGSNGTTPGPVIRLIGRSVLDGVNPNWTAETGTTVEHYIYDYKTPRQVLVYPTPSSDVYVEMVFSKNPAEISSASGSVALDDSYAALILDYVAFRAFSKDVDSQTSTAKAAGYMSMFSEAVGALTGATAQRVPASQQGGAAQ